MEQQWAFSAAGLFPPAPTEHRKTCFSHEKSMHKATLMQKARQTSLSTRCLLPPPVGALEPVGWSHNDGGQIAEGRPQWKGSYAYFKHTRALQPKDVWRTRVEVGGGAWVGFATEQFNAEKRGESHKSTAWVNLSDGTTLIYPGISEDGQQHCHYDHLVTHIPEAPFDLALRCDAVSNVPQIQFNDDDVWHDFAPGRAALKAGPWFPYLQLWDADVRLSDHSVHRPRAVKSAGKIHKAPAAASSAAAAGGAGAASDEHDESVPPPQKKARHEEGSSK
jgi:hypothetical protein